MNHAHLVLSRAQSDPDRVAVKLEGRAVTYGEFANLSEACGAALRGLGVGLGDTIMLFAENAVETLVLYHAAARIGAVLAPVHISFKVAEITYAVSNARPRLIVTTADNLEAVKAALAESGHQTPVALMDEGGDLHLGRLSPGLVLVGQSCPPVEVPPEQPLLISFTSGTTSLPKPVLRSHGAETWSANAYREAWGFEADDRLLVALSLSWVYGLCSLSQSAFAAGATVVLERKFSPTRTLELIEAGEVSVFSGPMTMYSMMLNVLKEQPFNTSGLRKALLGGEPRNERVVAEMEARLGLRLSEAWAMTESFPVLAIHPVKHRSAPSASLGRVVPGAEVRLVGDDGQDVQDGQPGEAWVRSPGDFIEYNGEPGLTSARRTADGWLRSGDLLRRDRDGYYHFVMRQGDLIIRGGANISPLEVESAICTHPEVADAVVVGLPDDVQGESVAALVVARTTSPLDMEALRAFVSDRIAAYKVPTFLIQVDAIPLGSTGKKNRSAAQKVAAEFRANHSNSILRKVS